jgi:hypothetical protein
MHVICVEMFRNVCAVDIIESKIIVYPLTENFNFNTSGSGVNQTRNFMNSKLGYSHPDLAGGYVKTLFLLYSIQ